MVEILNKIDLLPNEARAGLLDGNRRGKSAVAVSALTGAGTADLLARIEFEMTRDNIGLSLTLDANDGAALAWVYRHAQVVQRQERAGNIRLKLRIRPQDAARIQSRFPGKTKLNQKIAADS
jgi:GTP-binding protein HflX